MPRVHISRGKLSVIIEKWLEENADGGTIRYWDVADDGAFCGIVVDGVNQKIVDEMESNGDD